jgi:hypothetical protein
MSDSTCTVTGAVAVRGTAAHAVEDVRGAVEEAGYRLFLDFRHGDVVRTAAFTVTTGRGEPR